MADLTLARILRRGRRTLRITLAWVLVGALAAFVHWVLVRRYASHLSFPELLDYHVWRNFLWGLLGGGFYVFLLRDRLRQLPFLQAFGVMTVLVLIAVSITHAWIPYFVFSNTPDAIALEHFFQDPVLWTDLLYRDLLMAATMLLVRIYDQYGGTGFLLGRYYRPRQELRIFMFLDMRSSTAIAEAIGDTRYFQLLNDVYADLSDPVADSLGEIYQYVGDEISVSWPLHKGIKGERCLRCFFTIREKLHKRAAFYTKRYGSAPVFKAGFHYGQVTTGEVGLVKKQTIFSGDVVNTAAHIQARCNEHGVDNLMSKDLLDLLALKPERWTVKRIGEIPLKGKRNMVELATVSPAERGLNPV
ncbi:MAG TPA: adenylate/guanylate cyclase domain-containing protein [Flavobacteriales bacterium]